MLPTLLVATGFGLITAAASRLLFGLALRQHWRAVLGATAAMLVAAVVDFPAAVAMLGLLFVLALVIRLIRMPAIRAWGARALRAARRPELHWPLVAIGGAFFVAAGLARVDQQLKDIEFVDGRGMDDMMAMPPLQPTPALCAATDCGSPIPLHMVADQRDPHQLRNIEHQILEGQNWNDLLIRKKPAADVCNCHGWIFADGQFWLNSDDVVQILDDNGYTCVKTPQPGDLAVYHTTGGDICHTAIVRSVCDDGIVIVEGKWGWMGVFLHRVNESCYGQDFTYLRTDRPGHRLNGVQPATAIPQDADALAH